MMTLQQEDELEFRKELEYLIRIYSPKLSKGVLSACLSNVTFRIKGTQEK